MCPGRTEAVSLSHELRGETYRPGAYHYFEIFEPKRRVAAAAAFRDGVVHHAICRVIEPIWERRFISESYACRPGKGTHAGMRRALSLAKTHPWALCCDIQRYFPSISQGVLLNTIRRVIADPQLIDLVQLILESHAENEVREHLRPQQCLVSGTTPPLPVRPNACLRAAVGRTKPDAATAARRVVAMTGHG